MFNLTKIIRKYGKPSNQMHWRNWWGLWSWHEVGRWTACYRGTSPTRSGSTSQHSSAANLMVLSLRAWNTVNYPLQLWGRLLGPLENRLLHELVLLLGDPSPRLPASCNIFPNHLLQNRLCEQGVLNPAQFRLVGYAHPLPNLDGYVHVFNFTLYI